MKRILALIIAMTMLLLCGCSDKEKATDNSNPPTVAVGEGEVSKTPSDGKLPVTESDDSEEGDKTEEDTAIKNENGVIEGTASDRLDAPGEGVLTDEKFAYEDMEMIGDAATDDYEEPYYPAPEIQATAGTLTAGEIRDNEDFAAWSALVTSQWLLTGEEWKLVSVNRVVVDVMLEDNSPVLGAEVKLIDNDGKAIYTAVTDANGKAYLFYGVDGGDEVPVKISASCGGTEQSMAYDRNAPSHGFAFEKTDKIQKLDLMFVVDTTGSMGDEIAYLKAEVTEIINRAGNTGFSVRTSVNFYRDLSDEYVVKYFAFETDPQKVKQNVAEQYAAGGGDYEEAVDMALSNAVYDHAWDADSVKIMFLILDAPPHKDAQIIDNISKIVSDAAAKGIRIIPVASSGIDKETEFLLRSYATLTGGSYAFLTDTSGVGGSHLDPSVQEYKEEKLIDLMTRLIYQYCGAEYTAPEYEEIGQDDSQNITNIPTDPPYVVPDDYPVTNSKDVSYIEDLTDTAEVALPEEELFYEDESCAYFFGVIKSPYITVYYTDGTSENVVDALNNGNIKIEYLKEFNIDYFIKYKDMSSVNAPDMAPMPPVLTEPDDVPEDSVSAPNAGQIEPTPQKTVDYVEDLLKEGGEAVEPFYVDDEYVYSFPYIKSTGVIVHYTDGTAENIVDALANGHITIEQLKEHGVYFSVEEKSAEVDFGGVPTLEDILAGLEDVGVVKQDGFVNTESSPITCADDAIERAELECTVEYDSVVTYYSHISHTWAVQFSMYGTAGGDQTVYLNQSGITLLVIYGE